MWPPAVEIVAVVLEAMMIDFVPPPECGRYANFQFVGDHVGYVPVVTNVGVDDADAVCV